MASLKMFGHVWACLDCCFKGKCWYILKVISFIYIHVILTYLVKVNVGGMQFIYICSSYRTVFHCFLIRKKIFFIYFFYAFLSRDDDNPRRVN